MTQFALVKDALPIYTVNPANDTMIMHGNVFDGGVWREFPESITPQELIERWYFYRKWKQRPPIPGPYYVWNKSAEAWEYDPDSARPAKAAKIASACEASILAGFTSAALGADYHYPSDMADQANLTASVMRSTLSDDSGAEIFPFKCADSAGEWLFRPHTAAQIRQVGKDAYQHILELRQRNAELQGLLAAAMTEQEISSIVW